MAHKNKAEWYEYSRLYREKNRAEIRRKAKEKYREMMASKNEEKRRFFEANKEAIEARRSEEERKRIDSLIEYHRQYRAKNRDKHRAYSRIYYKQNTEAMIEYQKKYRSENKDKLSKYRKSAKRRVADVIRVNLRRERLTGIDSGTKRFYELAHSENQIRCYWCGKQTRNDGREVDHILPLALGGNASSSNLCIACKSCNRKKSQKHPNEFAKQGVLIWNQK